MYDLSYDKGRNLLTVVMQGYWTMETFRAYQAEIDKLHRNISQHYDNFRVLSDGREFDVQSAEVSEAFLRLAKTSDRQANKGPVAILTASVINRMQARRASPLPNVCVFSDYHDAMDWLFEEGRLPPG